MRKEEKLNDRYLIFHTNEVENISETDKMRRSEV